MTHTNDDDPTRLPNWIPLFQAFAEALEWALDRAANLARPYPAEVATIERVRTFIRRRTAGELAHLRVDDLLFAVGLIAGALERDLRPAAPAIAPMATPAPRPAAAPGPARTLRAEPRTSPLRIHHRTSQAQFLAAARGGART